MYTISFDKEALSITIHNQYPDLELTSPVYFSTGIPCYVSPSQKIDISNMTMEASFGIAFKQEIFEGALLYKLRKKHTTKTDSQSDNSTVFIDDTTANMHLLVVWNIGDDYHTFRVCLIECTNDFTWDEDKLWALYRDYNDQFREGYKSNTNTWLMNSGAVMKTRRSITYGSDYKLDIVISEGAGKYEMSKPIKIDPERLVFPSSILIALMYAISLSIQSSFKLNIHNQCLNVDLVSPMYITYGWLEGCKPPDHKVHAGDIMSSSFIIERLDDESVGTLICKLQRRQSYADRGAANVVQLLVVWRISESKELYVDVLLVEHDKVFIWNKDNLSDLYHKNINQFRLYSDPIIEIWSLNDSVALMTTFEIMNSGRILNVTISEIERYNYVRKPAHIDPER
jgi:hypothetical protein